MLDFSRQNLAPCFVHVPKTGGSSVEFFFLFQVNNMRSRKGSRVAALEQRVELLHQRLNNPLAI